MLSSSLLHTPHCAPNASVGGDRRFLNRQSLLSPLCRRKNIRLITRAETSQKKEDKISTPQTTISNVDAPKIKSSEVTNAALITTPSTPPQTPNRYGVSRKRAWFSIFLDQIVDSTDDISKHIRRQIKQLPTTTALEKLARRGNTYVMEKPSKKPVVMILGSGWGAHSLIKVIDTDRFEVVVVSPTNHFLFTPMLPSTAVGTVEFRSLLEPIRVANPFVSYLEARCDKVDLKEKVTTCTASITDLKGEQRTFQVPYDMLVIAIGEKPATFNVSGVKENCYFMKEVKDAVKLRTRIQEVFELASLPGTTEEDIKALLSFIVVGGGPTGVEFAGTLSDFLRQDLKKKYPELMPYVQVTLLQSQQTILTQFDKGLAERAMENFQQSGVTVRTGVRVTEVTSTEVVFASGERLNHGVCVWSAGNAPRNLVTDLATAIPEQAQHLPGGRLTKLAVDPFLRVIGARDVISIGDCSYIVGMPLPPTAQVAGQQGAYVSHVISRGYTIGVGGMDSLPPYKSDQDVLSLADRVFASIDTNFGSIDFGEVDDDGIYTDIGDGTGSGDGNVNGGTNSGNTTKTKKKKKKPVVVLKKPFEFLSLGVMAAIGNDKALIQVEVLDTEFKVWGKFAELIYKSVYINKQVSLRNRALILFDWFKTRVFGRDLSQF